MPVHIADLVFTGPVARPQYLNINTLPDRCEYSRATPKFRGLRGAGYILHDLRMKGGKQSPSKRRPFDMAKTRRDELDKLLIARTGSLSLETDDADLVAPIYAQHCETPEQATAALRARFPALGDVERASIVASAFARPQKYKADVIAKLLNITFEERERLGLHTIGSCDMSREERDRIAKARKSDRDRTRKEQERRAAGARPRVAGDKAAAEAAALGISRSALFKRRRKAKAAVHSNGASIKTEYTSTSAVRVHLPAQIEAAAQPPVVSDQPRWVVTLLVSTFQPSASPRWSIPVVPANSDPAIARLGARVSAHAAAHRRAAQMFATTRRAA